MSRLAVMSLDEVREYVEGGMYHEQDLVDLYEYTRMLRYEQDCINVLGHEKIQALERDIVLWKDSCADQQLLIGKLEQENTRLKEHVAKLEKVREAAEYTVLAMEWTDIDLNNALKNCEASDG